MSMPWDPQPRQSPPPYQPPPQIPPPQIPPPQEMRPDIPPPAAVPVTARNPQTGETVRMDIGAELRAAIQQAVTSAVTENKTAMQAQANKTIAKLVKAEVKEEVADEVQDTLEGSFSAGPATTRTFIQGAALDIGAAVMAIMATMVGPDSNLFDKELWTLVGVMVFKTVIQTGLSYAMKFKVG
jgi:hypothetical protein